MALSVFKLLLLFVLPIGLIRSGDRKEIRGDLLVLNNGSSVINRTGLDRIMKNVGDHKGLPVSMARRDVVVAPDDKSVSSTESPTSGDSPKQAKYYRAELRFGNFLDLTRRRAVADSDSDTVHTVAHQPLECEHTDSLNGSIDRLCVNSQQAWSCRDKCFYSIKAPCSCDVNCLLHNTCCLDFELQCPEVAASSREELGQFPGLYTVCDQYILSPLVSHCPQSASEEEHRLCGQSRQNMSSLLDMAPVSDSFYLWDFKNKHCWRCWHTGHEALRWQVNITMSLWNRMSEDYRLESLISFMASNEDKVQWYPPNDMVKAQCTDTVTSHCSACGLDNVTVDSCQNGPYAVVGTPSGVYKNMYCYLCSKHYQDGLKVTCSIKDLDPMTQHGMEFPVTMILPDGEDSSEVKLVQEDFKPGRYLWDKMTCSLSRGTCQVRQCTSSTVMLKGECNSGVRPLTLRMRFCEAGIRDGKPSCERRYGSLRPLSSLQQQQVLQRVVAFSDSLVQTMASSNSTLLDSTVLVTEHSSLYIHVMWALPHSDQPDSLMFRQFAFEMINLIPFDLASGTFLICSSWSNVNNHPKTSDTRFDSASCNLVLLCPPHTVPQVKADNSADTPGLQVRNFNTVVSLVLSLTLFGSITSW